MIVTKLTIISDVKWKKSHVNEIIMYFILLLKSRR